KAFAIEARALHALGSWLDYRLSLITGKPILRHYPPAIMIEPANICNLQCPLCPSGNNSLSRPRGFMPFERFERLLQQIKNRIGMLILWNQGEPFLNPEFYDMVRLAAKLGFYTMTSTNASLELDAKRIVQSGLSKIIISMDGISAETYNSYRINGDFELVLANMRELVKLKKLFKASTPLIEWQFIIMKHNEHEIPEVKRLAESLGVEKLEFKTAQIYTKDDMRFLPTDTKHSRYSKSGNGFELRTKLLNRCRRLWTQPVVNWDGEFSICCYDKDIVIPIGNIDHHTFEELWFGTAMMNMRRAVLTNRSQFAICRNCGEGIVQKLKL
ncbi:MAG: radical SAM/SPASM domain-containing protein, partial [Candidatus Cloacimonadaceae bacterium]|nr:radical SAM/SPASM domain-containing protein [Candidatus Cloacimonadaceae bacterium]